MNNAIMGMVSVVLLVVVILGFVNTLLMSVFERTKEIGMMMALGITPFQVQLIIVLEGLMIALISSIAAIVFGLMVVFYHKATGFDLSPFVGGNFEANQFSLALVIYPKISIWPFAKVIVFAFVIVFFSVLTPAYRASKLTPLDAIRS
ncbi:MAG: FtsX-like permease family protein [Bdellovibrionales bacterium]|nr:FtsX-like permease family protein [Bdellovibrionales bacterium]